MKKSETRVQSGPFRRRLGRCTKDLRLLLLFPLQAFHA